MLSYKEYEQKIDEGLILTHSLTSVKFVLDKWFDSFGLNFSTFVDLHNNTLKLNLFNSSTINVNFFESLLDFCNNLGIFPSEYIGTNQLGRQRKFKLLEDISPFIPNLISIQVTFESKFDLPIKDVPDKLYHISNSEVRKKILLRGLRTKSLKKLSNHPERIYLLTDINYASILQVFKNIDLFNNENNNYDLWEIDFKGLNKFQKKQIEVFNDPIFLQNGCWIYENIPKEFLTLLKTNI